MKISSDAQSDRSLPEMLPAAEDLLNTLPWGVLVLDEQHIIRRVNRQAARWCGASPEALVGQPLAGASLLPVVQVALLQLLEVADTTPCEVFLPQANQWLALSLARQAQGWVFYGQDITAQKQTARLAPVAGIRDQYHALLQVMDQGFCVLEVAFDESGQQAIDFRYLELNPVFAQQWGLPPNAQGRSARALRPGLEPFWLDTYGQVASTGAPVRFEHYVPSVGRWFEVHALRVAPPEARQVAVLVNDITARKHAEEALRSSEERQAFLLQFSDALRSLADPSDIQTQAARLLGEHLHLDRCGYADTQANNESVHFNFSYLAAGVPAFADTHRLADYGPHLLAALQRGETLAVASVASYPATADPATAAAYQAAGVGAFLAVPLLRHGRLRSVLFAHQREPRHWTPSEITLIEQVADRTWTAAECAQADADRRASEATLAAVFEALPVGVGLLDAHGQLTLANHQMQYYLPTGLMPSLDNTQHPRWRAYYPDGRPLPPSEFPGARALRGEKVVPGIEMCYSPPEGPAVWTQVIALPLPDEKGHVTVIVDIDAQKRTAEALRQSEEHFRLFLTASSDTIYRMSPDWRQMLTLSGQHFLADTVGPSTTWVEKYIPPQDQGLAWDTIHAAIAGKHTFELEHRVFRADGSLGWTASRAVPVLDAQGEITEWFGAATDITTRKASQEALRLSEARLSLALQAGRMGSFEWTSEGNRLSLSPMSADVLGLLPDTAVLTSDASLELLHPDDRERHQAIFEQAGRSGEDFHSIYRVVRPRDGAVRWIEERGQGTHDPATSNVCLRGVHWDVTETMLAQQRLAEFNTKLEKRVARRTRELQASRDLLQSVFDTNLIAMSVMEAVRDDTGAVRDFRLRLVSRELERETGRTDLVGKLYGQEYPGIHETGLFALALRTLETGQPQGTEYYYQAGSIDKWFICQFVKLGDGVVATNLDITERRTAEQERLKSLRLLEQAEAVAGLGSWDYDLATATLRWSAGMYQLFGLPLGQAVAPAFYLDLVVAGDRPRAQQLVHHLATGAGDFEATLRLRLGGVLKTIRTRFVVFRDAQQQAVRVLGVDLDITELQRLEQDNLRLRLRQQHALFEAVQVAQEAERKRMAESLHNGIGQILYATKLHLDRLHAPSLTTDPVLATARREADQLLREAIRQTRTLSHELVPMVLEEFGLAAALRDIGRKVSVSPLHLRSHVTLDADAAPLAPSLQMALYRMAQELAQNIVKHAHGATEASLELETMPDWVLLRAEDNGPGFAPGAADSPGLGLRSIRDQVALLGGQLETGSARAGGAYVRIRIPSLLPPRHTTPASG